MDAHDPAAAQSDSLWAAAPGGRLFVRWWNSAPPPWTRRPIVLVHDSLGSVELWRDFPARLAATTGHPVVAYDRLGFGRSGAHPSTLANPGFIADEARAGLAPVRQALGIERLILFGHSVGGAMALEAAAQEPRVVAAVITEAAQVFAEERTLVSIQAAKAAFAEPNQMERLARYHGDKAAWVLEAWTGTWLAPEFASWSLDAALPRLHCPMLVMHGDRDEYGSLAHPDRVRTLAPIDPDVVVFEDCGHVPHREYTEAVLEAVAAFLLRLPVVTTAI